MQMFGSPATGCRPRNPRNQSDLTRDVIARGRSPSPAPAHSSAHVGNRLRRLLVTDCWRPQELLFSPPKATAIRVVDAWAPLDGRVVNGGIRLAF